MEAKESKIIDILSANKKYIIPSYQRPYSWEETHVEELLDDICDSFSVNNREYFIGTLICIKKDGFNYEVYEVVDGQQRLTTLSLIFAKMKDLIIEKQGAREDLKKLVLQVDNFSDGEQEARLKVRKAEYDLYYHYILQGDNRFLPEPPQYTEQLYINNFQFIGEYLNKKFQGDEKKICDLANYILQRVYVVFVTTNDLVSSFRLFNVLNTRGLPLSASDLIKSKLFEVAESNDIDHKKIENYWSDIEKIVGVENIDKFLRVNIISRKRDRSRLIRELFTEYTELISGKYDKRPIDFVVDLKKSAENYRKIKKPTQFQSIQIRKILSPLNLITDEWVPAILAFLNKSQENTNISDKDFQKFIEVFEKCYMQSWFRKHDKSEREAIVYSALVAINNNKDFSEIVESITKHANNEEFTEALSDEIFKPHSSKANFIKALLLRIDQEIQDENVFKEYGGSISVEHVLPRNATDSYWESRFSPEEHEYWLHRLGNLTLISGSKNSRASNRSFDQKKQTYDNPKKSFDITREIC